MSNIKIFESNDAAYLSWIKDHPGHFVVNTHRRPRTTYFILHSSKCHCISTIREGGAYSERNYIKVCGRTQKELMIWFQENRANFMGEFNKCKKCIPTLHIDTDYPFFDFDISENQDPLLEGAQIQVITNKYERNPKARAQCLSHYGHRCAVCSFDFAETYGEIGQDYIHVHHLKEISEISSQYVIDPIKDLRPVCPNCHAMLHREKPCLSIEALTERLKSDD